jgi:hypothetical protein
MIWTGEMFLKNLWRDMAGVKEIDYSINTMPPLPSLQRSEWSEQFDILAKNKMVQAAFRYGLFNKNNDYDFIEAMKNKIALYEKTHNTELMVDVRNYAMLEFKKPKYADAYYHAEDDTEHAPLKNNSNLLFANAENTIINAKYMIGYDKGDDEYYCYILARKVNERLEILLESIHRITNNLDMHKFDKEMNQLANLFNAEFYFLTKTK